MGYFGHKRTSWLCSGPRACSKKPPYSRNTWAVLSLARCVTAWWMIAKGGAEDTQPGQVWHEGIVGYTCAGIVHWSLSHFCPSVPEAWNSGTGAVESSYEGIPLIWCLKGGDKHPFFFVYLFVWFCCPRRRFWLLLKLVLLDHFWSKRRVLGGCREPRNHVTHGSQLFWDCTQESHGIKHQRTKTGAKTSSRVDR